MLQQFVELLLDIVLSCRGDLPPQVCFDLCPAAAFFVVWCRTCFHSSCGSALSLGFGGQAHTQPTAHWANAPSVLLSVLLALLHHNSCCCGRSQASLQASCASRSPCNQPFRSPCRSAGPSCCTSCCGCTVASSSEATSSACFAVFLLLRLAGLRSVLSRGCCGVPG